MTQEPRLCIGFVHHDRPGTVSVTYGPNDSVVGSGFDLLAGSGWDVNMCLGYPALHAWVSEYAGTGYRRLLAWIQVIVSRRYSSLPPGALGETTAEVDVPEDLRALGVPFFAYGYPAALYDAPCNNLGDSALLEWRAETFLVTFPSRLTANQIAFLAGFGWGYAEWDEEGQRRVALRPLEALDRAAWEAHLPLLCRDFPQWTYR